MKRIFLIVTLAIILVNFQNLRGQNTIVDSSPVMTFQKTIHDFGTLKKGQEAFYDFVFTNTGKEPLILSKPRSSCGCTVPEWPQEPIMPGQSNKIRITYNTNIVGPFNKQVTIISNASNSPIVLQVKGNVIE